MRIRIRDDFTDARLPTWGRYRYFGTRQYYYCLGPVIIEGPDFEWKR
jgi:hypothetical protein